MDGGNSVRRCGHPREAVKVSGGDPRRCRKRTGTLLRVEVALVLDAPLSLFPALYDEGGVSGFIAHSPAVLQGQDKTGIVIPHVKVFSQQLETVFPLTDVEDPLGWFLKGAFLDLLRRRT